MATLINTTSGNISNFVWNLVDDKYLALSGLPSNTQSNSGTKNVLNSTSLTYSLGANNNFSFCTFSGGYSVSHIGLRVAYGTTTSGIFSLALATVVGLGFSSSIMITNSRVDLIATASLTTYDDYNKGISNFGTPGSLGDNSVGLNTIQMFRLPQIISLPTGPAYTILYNISSGSSTANQRPNLVTTFNYGTQSISCFLVTTTTQSRTVNDDIIITGEIGTNSSINSFTISVDTIRSSATFSNIMVTNYGSLVYSTASAYNPYMKIKGDLTIMANGFVSIGMSGSPIPVNSTASMEFVGTYSSIIGISGSTINYENLGYGSGIKLRTGGSFYSYSGLTLSYKTVLTSTFSVGSRTASVSTSTNWKAGDYVVVAPTETYTDRESFTVSVVNSATISFTSAANFLHRGGAFPFIAEVVNLTRNIKIFSPFSGYPTSISNVNGYLYLNQTELYNIGVISSTNSNYTYGREGIYMFSNNLAYNYNRTIIENSSIRDTYSAFSTYDTKIGGLSLPITNINFDNNIVYNFTGLISFGSSNVSTTTHDSSFLTYTPNYGLTYSLSNFNITNNIFLNGSTVVIWQQDVNFFSNVIAGMNPPSTMIINSSLLRPITLGILANYKDNGGGYTYLGEVKDNVIHTNFYASIIQSYKSKTYGKTFSNLIFWGSSGGTTRGAGIGLQPLDSDIVFENCAFYSFIKSSGSTGRDEGCGGVNLYNLRASSGEFTFINCTFSNNSQGIYLLNDNLTVKLNNCYFSNNSTADLDFEQTSGSSVFPFNPLLKVIGNNTQLLSTTQVTGKLINQHSFIKINRITGTGSFKSWYSGGIVQSDGSTQSISGSSVRATPSTTIRSYISTQFFSATQSGLWLVASQKTIPVFANNYLSISVYVKKSTSTDGAAYNGSQPRLIIGSNSDLGITYDTILATATASNGIYELLTATTSVFTKNSAVNVWVDCNGSTGWINVDDWSINYKV